MKYELLIPGIIVVAIGLVCLYFADKRQKVLKVTGIIAVIIGYILGMAA